MGYMKKNKKYLNHLALPNHSHSHELVKPVLPPKTNQRPTKSSAYET
jgi:hypothetical protein